MSQAFLILGVFLFSVGSDTANAQVQRIWHVDLRARAGLANGTNWPNAFTNLQSALSAASSGDEIWVGPGTYSPATSSDRAATFRLKDGVGTYGSFKGTETSRSQRILDLTNNPTILSGEIVNGNSYHVVTATNVSSSAVLDGFVILGGRATGTGLFQERGAGILCNAGGSPTLRNLVFEAHSGTFGGALYANQSSPTISQTTFQINSASQGGAVYFNQGTPLLLDVTFYANTASNLGGAVRAVDSSVTFSNVMFLQNRAQTDNGGALHVGGVGAVRLVRCAFTNNSASTGGGLYNDSQSNLSVTDTIFAANSATSVGGAICNNFSNPTLVSCAFFGNRAVYGGAIRNNQCGPIVINGLFVGNLATIWGGAMYNADNSTGEPRLINCTFSANHGASGGGAIQSSSATPALTNCIVWANTPNQVVGPSIGNPNLIQGVSGAGDPRFVRNPNSGDGSWATLSDNDYGNLRLRANSPALHVGTNSALPLNITTDLDGLPRIAPPAIDLGAYEAPFISSTIYAVPFGNLSVLSNWIAGESFEFELVSTTGNLAFEVPPTPLADGTIRFLLKPGTTGTAVFQVLVDGISYVLTLEVMADIYARAAFDYTARTRGPQTSINGRARIRGFFQPVGPRKGIAIFPGAFDPNLATFTSYPAALEIDTGDGRRPAGSPLSGLPLVALNQGFDVYLVDWHNARTYLQANAMVVVEMLADLFGPGLHIDPTHYPALTDQIRPDEKLALIGQSMGGLISRFALCYLDTENIPYRSDLFLSVDSPQEGAYIPIGLQHLALYLDDLPDEYTANFDTSILDTALDAINQPAPRQMLLLHHSRASFATPPYYADERKAFLSLLNTNGNWPTNPNLRMAAVANGRGDGNFEERGGYGAFPAWPKPDGDLRILRWGMNAEVHNSTTNIFAPSCLDGELHLEVNAYVTNTTYALNPPQPFRQSLVFQATAFATIYARGVHILFGIRTATNSGSGVIDTSGTEEEILVNLRESIKQKAGMTGFTCGIVNDGIDSAIRSFVGNLADLEAMNTTAHAYSAHPWDWVPGGYSNKGQDAAAALGSVGSVSKVSNFQCFVPTVSALALSDFVPPAGVPVPANAVDLSPFDALYHFGNNRNTGHLDDFNDWLSQIVAHELRMLCGEFKLRIQRAPLAVSWPGMYQLEAADLPSGPWSTLLSAQDHTYSPTVPPDRRFFRLRFSNVYE